MDDLYSYSEYSYIYGLSLIIKECVYVWYMCIICYIDGRMHDTYTVSAHLT